jgi:hypothetical protein
MLCQVGLKETSLQVATEESKEEKILYVPSGGKTPAAPKGFRGTGEWLTSRDIVYVLGE